MKMQTIRQFRKVLRFLRERRRKSCLKKAIQSVFYNKPGKGFDLLKYFQHERNFKTLKRAFDKVYGRTIGHKVVRKLRDENIRSLA
jgi:hypothetical protein